MNPDQNSNANQTESPPAQSPQPLQSNQPIVPPVDPTLLEQHDYTHPIVDPPTHVYHPKRFKVWLSVFVAVCILAVVAMLLVALLPATGKKSTQDTPKTDMSSKNKAPVTAELAITHIKEHFKATGQATTPLLRPIQAPQMAYFTVVPDVEPLVSIAGDVEPAKAKNQLTVIDQSLVADNLKKVVISDGTNGSNYQAFYTSTATTCELDQSSTKTPKAPVHIEAKCLDTAVYASYAAAQQPLVSMYTPLSATSVQYGFVGKPTITAGSTPGYQRGQLQVSTVISDQLTSSGQVALYYQTPDGLWHYFTDQDNNVAIDCAKYNNNDLLSAYSGTACRNISKGTAGVVPAPRKK